MPQPKVGSSWVVLYPNMIYGCGAPPAYGASSFPAVPFAKDTILVVLECCGEELIGGKNTWFKVVSSMGTMSWVAVGAWVDGALESVLV